MRFVWCLIAMVFSTSAAIASDSSKSEFYLCGIGSNGPRKIGPSGHLSSSTTINNVTVKITRPSTKQVFNITAKEAQSFFLQPGDVVYIHQQSSNHYEQPSSLTDLLVPKWIKEMKPLGDFNKDTSFLG